MWHVENPYGMIHAAVARNALSEVDGIENHVLFEASNFLVDLAMGIDTEYHQTCSQAAVTTI